MEKRDTRATIALIAALFFATVGLGAADAKRLSAGDIIDRMTEHSMMGFDEGKASVDMILRDKRGKERKRRLSSRVIKNKSGDRKTALRFGKPSDIRGTALLILERDDDDDLYLYLPAFERTRRIASSEKDKSFVGTDFSYGDLEQRDINNARHKRKKDKEIEGEECYVVEARPRDSKLYETIIVYVRKSDFLAQRIVYYDDAGDVAKAYRLLESREIDGEPAATKSQMSTKKSGQSTFLILRSLDRDADIPKSLFSPSALGDG